ncbi:MAG: hypothetical protein GDA37_03370 [Ekhidna sp.]|nr:hypothetical protein [Ekhidna sp.]
MFYRGFLIIFFGIIVYLGYAQVSPGKETYLAGVYQGKTLFIQNPFNRDKEVFCVREIRINERTPDINYNLSAIMINFEGYDLYTPVKIRIIHADTLCHPVILNPESILFHTIFRFLPIHLTDSALVWSTKGERGKGYFEVQRLENGIWEEKAIVEAKGKYEGAGYLHRPALTEGANKYRIKYNFPRSSRIKYLYSSEVELEHYPDRVRFSPKLVKTHLYLSRVSHYEIYDQGNNLVQEGQGKAVDVSKLRKGRYVIYFNGKFPGPFSKE